MDGYVLKELATKCFPTTILLTYIDHLDIDELFHACHRSKFSTEKVLKTKCGSTLATISYLLSLSNPIGSIINFNNNKAYTFEIQGVSINGRLTNTGHCFILIGSGVNWLTLDSYIGERELSCNIVDLESINKIILDLKEEFSDELWLKLTGSHNNDVGEHTSKVKVMIYEYDYSLENINKMFLEVLQKAKTKLNEESEGTDDSYLSLLSTTLNVEDANKYELCVP